MRWGQSRTTQLQPVLVCCARLRCVPTVFCCLLLDFLCSDALVFLPLHVFASLLFSVPSCSVADFPFSFFLCYMFLNLLLKLPPQQFFELNISISYTFVVFFFFFSLSLKLKFVFLCLFSFLNKLPCFCSCGVARVYHVSDFLHPLELQPLA